MDGGLSRTPQPADRRVVNRAEPSGYRQPEEPQPIPSQEPPKAPIRRASEPRSSRQSKRAAPQWWMIAVIALSVIVLGLIAWIVFASGRSQTAGIDASKYQTIYLMNGQIYLGKLSAINDTQYRLTNVYYLQTTTAQAAEGQQPTAQQDSNSLIKLSNAIYGPEDEMIISKDQVLYFQNLNADGRGAQLIENDSN